MRRRCTGWPAPWMGRRHVDPRPPSLDLLVPPWDLARWRPLAASCVEGCNMGKSCDTASPRLATHHRVSLSPLSHLFLLSACACCNGYLCLVVLGGLHGLFLALCVNDYISMVMRCPLISIGVERQQLWAAASSAGLEVLLPAVYSSVEQLQSCHAYTLLLEKSMCDLPLQDIDGSYNTGSLPVSLQQVLLASRAKKIFLAVCL